MIAKKGLLVDLAVTLYRIFAGFFLAAAVGITLGILMGTSRRLYAICDIFIAAIYPIPKISLLPLIVIWLGTGNTSLVALSALACIFPILVNTIIGVRQCDEGLILAARDLGATRGQIQRKIVLPAAIPSIFAGLRLALGISIIMVVAAEMQLSKYGIGARLTFAGQRAGDRSGVRHADPACDRRHPADQDSGPARPHRSVAGARARDKTLEYASCAR